MLPHRWVGRLIASLAEAKRDGLPMRISMVVVIASLVAGCASAPPSSEPGTTVGATPTPQLVTPTAAAPSATHQPTPAPTVAPTVAPTATPTVAPTATPQPWATYKSKREHYVIQYPPTWVVTPGSATRADQFDGYGYPYLYVQRDVVPRTVSISATVSGEKAYYKSHYKAKLISNKAVKLHGYSGRLLTFKGDDNGLKVQVQELILAKGRVCYFLEMWSMIDDAAADKVLFKKIYKTWRPT